MLAISNSVLIDFTEMFFKKFLNDKKIKAHAGLIKDGEVIKPTFGGTKRTFQSSVNFSIEDEKGPIDLTYTVHLTATRKL